MKIIFLDNDGVICLQKNWGSRFKKQHAIDGWKDLPDWKRPTYALFDNFDRKAIKTLNQIISDSDAEIVVSSDWRLKASIEDIGGYYLEQGIIKAPIDYTRVITEFDYPDNFPFYRSMLSEQNRSLEIKDWLSRNDVTHWVAIDDMDMRSNGRKWGLDNFVWTPNSLEGIKQTGKKQEILNYLL